MPRETSSDRTLTLLCTWKEGKVENKVHGMGM